MMSMESIPLLRLNRENKKKITISETKEIHKGQMELHIRFL